MPPTLPSFGPAGSPALLPSQSAIFLCPVVLDHPSTGQIYLTSGQDPRTQMMTSLNICGTVSYDIWHPHSHPLLIYFHPTILLPSGLLPSKPTTCRHKHPWLIPMKISYHPCIVFTGPVLWTSKRLATQHNPTGRDWTSSCDCINLSMCQLPVATFKSKETTGKRPVEVSFNQSFHMRIELPSFSYNVYYL